MMPRIGLPRRVLLLLPLAGAARAARRAARGFNVIQTETAPFGSPAAAESFRLAARLGADSVALIPFLWQARPDSAEVVRGSDMSDAQLAAGIRQARAAGLTVMVKLHVWVPTSWAGEVQPSDAAGWRSWFAGYRAALLGIARVAREEGAAALNLGTELRRTSSHPAWGELIAAARAAFPGTLLYTAHNAEEAERVPFWGALDAIGASLYPALGADDAPAGWQAAMEGEAARLDTLSAAQRRPVWVTEIGLRSAVGAAAKPWESAEERAAEPDEVLQARVLDLWLRVLDRPAIAGALVWRWFSDPRAGGLRDTDFTVQGKRAEGTLLARWRGL
jgi:hypothetical protein